MNNPSPKARFLTDPTNIKVHRHMIDSDPFTRACDVALLEYQAQCVQQIRDGNTAMAAGLKIQGAQEVLREMKLLSEAPMATNLRVNDNLQSTP